MGQIKAHLIKGIIGAMPADDGKVGLIGFRREAPEGESDELWLAVPIIALPHTASAVIQAIPKPVEPIGKYPAVFKVQSANFVVGADSEVVLSFEFEQGAILSIQLDESQASALAGDIQNQLSGSGIVPPPSTQIH